MQDGQIIIAVENTQKQAYDPQDGTQLIPTFSYETPKIEILGRADAEKAINEYVAMLDETYVTGEDYGDGQELATTTCSLWRRTTIIIG